MRTKQFSQDGVICILHRSLWIHRSQQERFLQIYCTSQRPSYDLDFFSYIDVIHDSLKGQTLPSCYRLKLLGKAYMSKEGPSQGTIPA